MKHTIISKKLKPKQLRIIYQRLNKKNWLQWADQKADWYDPLVEKEDNILFNVDKEKLEFKKSSW